MKYSFNIIFLLPYSPELNPIEKYWYVLKHGIKTFLYYHLSLNNSVH
ncbi:MAG: transposase [Ruminococcus sp.]|nr:transposase [Ruminococcus sp.]